MQHRTKGGHLLSREEVLALLRCDVVRSIRSVRDDSDAAEYTQTTFKSCRFNVRSSANADPITFRSAHKLPVGMETSMFVPR